MTSALQASSSVALQASSSSGLQASSSLSKPSEKRGYWVERFCEIVLVEGEKRLTFEELRECADILYKHREEGNPIWENPLKNLEEYDNAIVEMDTVYRNLEGKTEISERAILLNTLFMKTISQESDSPLTSVQKDYVVKKSLPSALEACGAEYLLDNDAYRKWLEAYRIACSNPKTLDLNILLFEKCTDDQKALLDIGRKKITALWYPDFKTGDLNLEDVHLLLDLLKGKPQIQEAVKEYKELSLAFSGEAKELFWAAAVSNLQKFIDMQRPK